MRRECSAPTRRGSNPRASDQHGVAALVCSTVTVVVDAVADLLLGDAAALVDLVVVRPEPSGLEIDVEATFSTLR
jgi:hypothetical protein